MSTKPLKLGTPQVFPTGKIRLSGEVTWHLAPRGVQPDTHSVSRILAACDGCGFMLGTGAYHAKAIAIIKKLRSKSEARFWCEYCVQEMIIAQEVMEDDVLWILTTEQQEHLGTTLTKYKFQQLVEAAA